ncbi:7-carboxy-7-deazaguanine synthase [uncultured archaeon]|nr:7-carboxy-7-deazaguanine synthase [uncultured archaeon]
MTENCNLRCSHCYMSAGPRKKETTTSSENFQKMLEHLPDNDTRMVLTGGEIFTVEDSLRDYLELIKSENNTRKKSDSIRVLLQTNGFWLNGRNAEKLLSYLKEMDVTELDVSSYDRRHAQQGLRLKQYVKGLVLEYFPKSGFRGVDAAVMPLGRAKKARKSYSAEYCIGANKKKKSSVTIRSSGIVSPCCFSLLKYEGNVFEEPLLDILNRARENPRLQALNRSGFIGLAKYDKIDFAHLEQLINQFGECGACAKIYGQKLR